MWTGSEVRAGATYLLDDYSVIQVLEVRQGRVRYRARTRLWWRATLVRRARLARLTRRVRAEIDGRFFPDIADPGAYRFARPRNEAAALDAHLAGRAPHRPFVGQR